ncbi:MAG: hypothetical protein M3323_11190 [Actinomycetota bacterium]|nr:hypothetical protein [Actinomycetota bacterium]
MAIKTGKLNRIKNVDGGFIPVRQRPEEVLDGAVDLDKPATVVWHETQTNDVPAYRPNTAPHLTVPSKDEVDNEGLWIAQHIGLGRIGNALVSAPGGVQTNFWARLQVEVVAFTTIEPTVYPSPVAVMVASIAEFAEEELGVPRKRLFPNVLDPKVTWATTSNPRRESGKWGQEAGHFAHVEIPENSHWDCGSRDLSTPIEKQGQAADSVVRWQVVGVKRTKGEAHPHKVELTQHMKLPTLGRKLENDGKLNRDIEEKQSKGFNVRLVDHLVPRSFLDGRGDD